MPFALGVRFGRGALNQVESLVEDSWELLDETIEGKGREESGSTDLRSLGRRKRAQ